MQSFNLALQRINIFKKLECKCIFAFRTNFMVNYILYDLVNFCLFNVIKLNLPN